MGCGPTRIDRWMMEVCFSSCLDKKELDYMMYYSSEHTVYCVCGNGSFQQLKLNEIGK